MKKINLINIGCKVNFAETSRLKEMFEKMGFDVVGKSESPDIILINTCTVTNRADADCRATIRKAKRENPSAFVGVFGCFAQLNHNEISEMPEVNAVFGMKEKFLIPSIIAEKFEIDSKIHSVSDLSDMHFDHAFSADSESRARAFLKIQDGCNYKCTYCTIPAARGESRGIDFHKLPNDLMELRSRGYREVVLTGINLADYNYQGTLPDSKYDFDDVLNLIAEKNFGFRMRVSSIEPNLISREAIKTICHSSHFCPHFHIPLQSGSNEILALMKRRYKREVFENVVLDIMNENPNTCIGVDVICGFPGETDEHFEETYNFIAKLPISYLHVFTYSERKGTPAAEMKGKVSHIKRKERTNSLRELSQTKYDGFCKSQVGKTGFFLPETYKSGFQIGHTENYVKCKIETKEKMQNEIFKIIHIEYTNGIMKSKLV